MERICCEVNARFLNAGETHGEARRDDGTLTIERLSNLCFLLHFTDASQCLSFDLDDLHRIDASTRLLQLYHAACSLTTSASILLRVRDTTDMQIFINAYKCVKTLVELTLRRNTICQDIISSSGLLKRSPRPNEIRIIDAADIEDAQMPACIYCRDKWGGSSDLCLYVHPYVPLTQSATDVFLCERCLVNWIDYRKRSMSNSGDMENSCAVCSATPSVVVECSTCRRVFCYGCLADILSPSDYDRMMRCADWACPSCNFDVPKAVNSSLVMIEDITALVTLRHLYARPVHNKQRSQLGEVAAKDSNLSRETLLFREYVQGHVATRSAAMEGMSEDVCFACKDGGEVVECESNNNCGKVYHVDCLRNKHLPLRFICPRHTCCLCGGSFLAVACLYCPQSFCARCFSKSPPAILENVYEVSRGVFTELPGELKYIACMTCSSLLSEAFTEDAVQALHLRKINYCIEKPVRKRKNDPPALPISERVQVKMLRVESAESKRSIPDSSWTDNQRKILVLAVAKYPTEAGYMRLMKKSQFNLIVNDEEFIEIAYYSYESFRKEMKILRREGMIS